MNGKRTQNCSPKGTYREFFRKANGNDLVWLSQPKTHNFRSIVNIKMVFASFECLYVLLASRRAAGVTVLNADTNFLMDCVFRQFLFLYLKYGSKFEPPWY